MKVVFVHGACVRDGEWWWHRTASALDARGISSAAPPLPSCGEAGAQADGAGPTMSDDAASVRRLLVSDDDETVVVGHSYGGIVASQAAAGLDHVRHLVYIASYLPEMGESMSTFGGEEPAPFLDVDVDRGTFTVRQDRIDDVFLQDCDAEIQRAAHHRTAHQSVAVLGEPVTATAWRDVPTTYVVCADDRGTPAVAQRSFATRADRTIEVDAGHHPFISQPDVIADIIAELATDQGQSA